MNRTFITATGVPVVVMEDSASYAFSPSLNAWYVILIWGKRDINLILIIIITTTANHYQHDHKLLSLFISIVIIVKSMTTITQMISNRDHRSILIIFFVGPIYQIMKILYIHRLHTMVLCLARNHLAFSAPFRVNLIGQ